jgi:hypothetical protein
MIWRTWTTAQWASLVAVLLIVIAVLVLLWPRPPDSVTIQVIDSSQGKVYSTQVIPLH